MSADYILPNEVVWNVDKFAHYHLIEQILECSGLDHKTRELLGSFVDQGYGLLAWDMFPPGGWAQFVTAIRTELASKIGAFPYDSTTESSGEVVTAEQHRKNYLKLNESLINALDQSDHSEGVVNREES